MNQGTHDAPKDTTVLEQDPQRIVRPTVECVHGPDEVAYGMDELVVLCLVRDGRPFVRSFVEHYSSMGVKHMVFLDNGSTDGTVEALKDCDNVTVLRSRLPFRDYQLHMRRYLIRRFGGGRWSLSVDIDELFDSPRKSRYDVEWDAGTIAAVQEGIDRHEYLRGYSYEE